MRKALSCLLLAALASALLPAFAAAADPPKTAKAKKIVLIGMDRDHGPGDHEYMAGLNFLAESLKHTPGVQVEIVNVGKGFPDDAKFLDKAEDANAIVCYLRRAGDLFRKKEQRERLEGLLKKGVGFVCLHYAVEGGKEQGEPFMAALGGYYEPGYSDNPHNKATVQQADPSHPISRGWKPFEARDEFYFKIRLLPEAKPVLQATLTGHDKKEYKDQTIGWTYERKDSSGPLGPGRSFGFTGCHFVANFLTAEFRRMLVNAILWSADVEVPEKGAPL